MLWQAICGLYMIWLLLLHLKLIRLRATCIYMIIEVMITDGNRRANDEDCLLILYAVLTMEE